MIVEHGFTTDDSRSITGSCEVENLRRRAFGIAWNTSGARFQHAEVSHTPFGFVATHEHHAVALLDSLARKETGDACCELAQIGVRVLLLAPVALDTHGNTCCVALGRSLEQLEQIAISVNTVRL